ncbi:membrane protein [Sphaerisporangium krabiense]|uniref:Putative membrane protein n=1 Tax=Sphaerisporangium krabiense TaxID=763782 RepID=A0A7W8Z865_9ACTN|nr:carotenoid biosynthesis protein [Sphaerisporangium krabiense]MBB5628873.1 putative membrane protein [Sphaerisporangium krabiense]GII60286.1 membrane protein [Sphaerisporangium krabiense]
MTTETPEETRARDARRGAGRRFAAAGALLLVSLVCAQVATGILPEDVRMTTLVVVLFAGCALAYAAAGHGLPRAAGAFAAAAAVGYAAEWIGIRTGLPFGEYRYGGLLWPSPGGVPLIVALAWAGMGLAAWAVACRIVPGPVPSRRRAVARAATGALALTAWDLFLDPQMTRLGLWEWADAGPYRGVPLGNFAGWLLVSLLVMIVIGAVVGEPARGGGLVTLYTVMAVMETVAFAAVFRPPDPLVAAVGGVAMGTFALLAWRRRWRR